ncbi:MAG: hypothetical protein CTY34_12215 [Methylobacter sp.]
MAKQLIKYEADGEVFYVEAERQQIGDDDDISRDSNGIIEGGKFEEVIAGLKPVANSVLGVLKNISEPAEIALEMGIKLGAKAGIIFASTDSEATLKVTIKWQKPK